MLRKVHVSDIAFALPQLLQLVSSEHTCCVMAVVVAPTSCCGTKLFGHRGLAAGTWC